MTSLSSLCSFHSFISFDKHQVHDKKKATVPWCYIKNDSLEDIWQLLHRLVKLPIDVSLNDLLDIYHKEKSMYWFMFTHHISWYHYSKPIEDQPKEFQKEYEKRCRSFYHFVLTAYQKKYPSDKNTIQWFHKQRNDITWWPKAVWQIIMVLDQIQLHQPIMNFLLHEIDDLMLRQLLIQQISFQKDNIHQMFHKWNMILMQLPYKKWQKKWMALQKKIQVDTNLYLAHSYLVPNLACQLINHFLHKWDTSLKLWSVVQILGSGIMGTTLLLTPKKLSKTRQDIAALKLMVSDRQAQWLPIHEEIRMQKKMAAAGIGTHIWSEYHQYQVVGIMTERMHLTFLQFLDCWYHVYHGDSSIAYQVMDQLESILDTLCKIKCTHGDMHLNNIMLQFLNDKNLEMKVKLIDFGMSTDHIYFPQLDICKLIGHFHILMSHSPSVTLFLKLWKPRLLIKTKTWFLQSSVPVPDLIGKINKWTDSMYIELFQTYYEPILTHIDKDAVV